jgi:hypothetical protein
MGLHDPFGHLKNKLWPKEGPGVKLPIWARPLKVENLPNFLMCRWHVTHRWKSFNKGYNFASGLISIEGLHTKLWAPKVVGVPTLGISGLPLRSPRKKWHLGASSVARHIVYYKGEGGGFPQVQAMVSLWVCVCLCFVGAPKCSNYALTKLLFRLCRFVWVIELLVNLLSLIPKLQHAPPPPKCYEPGSTPQLLFLPLSSLLDS